MLRRRMHWRVCVCLCVGGVGGGEELGGGRGAGVGGGVRWPACGWAGCVFVPFVYGGAPRSCAEITAASPIASGAILPSWPSATRQVQCRRRRFGCRRRRRRRRRRHRRRSRVMGTHHSRRRELPRWLFDPAVTNTTDFVYYISTDMGVRPLPTTVDVCCFSTGSRVETETWFYFHQIHRSTASEVKSGKTKSSKK